MIVKELKRRVRPRWVSDVRGCLVSRHRLAGLTRRFGLRPLSGNPLARVKKSDTLFILGSGDSINEIRAQEWSQISSADSLGFNGWYLHAFVPSVFVTEPGKDLDQLALEYASIEKRYAGRDTPILIKDMERYRREEMASILEVMPRRLHPRIALTWDWELREDDPARFSARLARLARLGIVTGAGYPVIRTRSSVFYLLVLALRAGYRRIVLCGIDLNGSEYFYEACRSSLEAEGYWVPPRRPLSATHKTEDPGFGPVTVSVALDALHAEVLHKLDISLYVAFRSSKLYSIFPAYFGR
ncbi:MAG TPA: hypothetical protein DHV08_12650 [Rhodocyclaceae bacterium]|nr:MAG: hypothetical protein AUK49_03860 [Betaproteobacteria bacterium CG2_30_68_42]PIV72128.1 MAG: hypothetical protein COW56_10940 [Rhodocyclales bacterium CG17_big_fil_post_rev_8_21_14_2_50_68_7]PJA56731.1 MAG: hypothetical protein CO164_11480 [Rhodocyclales bacterium CG_4_9_14_3_um_filter_68_10]HCX34295.1 hypothetical protein [Rhodocyclaceae bacterium]